MASEWLLPPLSTCVVANPTQAHCTFSSPLFDKTFGQIIPQINQLSISQPMFLQQQPMSGTSIGPLLIPSEAFDHNMMLSSSQVLSSVVALGGSFNNGLNLFPYSQVGTNTIVSQTVQTIPMAISIGGSSSSFLGGEIPTGGQPLIRTQQPVGRKPSTT
jgi:hypothetical protein